MKQNIFDAVAADYERIHDRSLPFGVRSSDFIAQRAAQVEKWIVGAFSGPAFSYLDFGCGNGRTLRSLLGSRNLQPLVENGRLRLFGFDISRKSICEARHLLAGTPVRLASEWREFPAPLQFDLVTACHVFHHIPSPERLPTIEAIGGHMQKASRLVVWEHNPVNPFARLLVTLCPFDRDARLMALGQTRKLFAGSSFRFLRYAYVNLFPPGWMGSAPLRRLDRRLGSLPLGTQYWAMFQYTAD